MNAISSPISLRIIMIIFYFSYPSSWIICWFRSLSLISGALLRYWIILGYLLKVMNMFLERSEYWVRLVDYECTSLQLLGNKLPQNLWLQMTHIDYLILSMPHELKPGIAGFSTQGLTGCNEGIGQNAFSLRELTGRELLPSSLSFFFDRIYFLVAIWMRTLVFASCWLRPPLDPRGHIQFLKTTENFLPYGLLQHSLLFQQAHKK